MALLRLATWNVTTLSFPNDHGEEGYVGKLDMFQSQFEHNGYHIVALQETRVPGRDANPIPGQFYDTYLSGTEIDEAGGGRRKAGVGICVHKSIARHTRAWTPISERMGWLTGTWTGTLMAIIVVYAPTQAALAEDELEEGISEDRKVFYNNLEMVLTSMPAELQQNCCVLGDFNARVGRCTDEEDDYN